MQKYSHLLRGAKDRKNTLFVFLLGASRHFGAAQPHNPVPKTKKPTARVGFCLKADYVSRQKQLSVVFDVANAQKQGVMGARLASRTVRLCFKRREQTGKMDVDLILKVAGISMIITVVCQIMSKAGRDEQSTMVSLAGMVVILLLIAERVGDLLLTIRRVFGI